MLDEQVVVAVVVKYADAGCVCAGRNHKVRGRKPVMANLNELALRRHCGPFNLPIDLHSREEHEVSHHRRVVCA